MINSRTMTCVDFKTAANKGIGIIGARRWNIGCSSLSVSVSAGR